MVVKGYQGINISHNPLLHCDNWEVFHNLCFSFGCERPLVRGFSIITTVDKAILKSLRQRCLLSGCYVFLSENLLFFNMNKTCFVGVVTNLKDKKIKSVTKSASKSATFISGNRSNVNNLGVTQP